MLVLYMDIGKKYNYVLYHKGLPIFCFAERDWAFEIFCFMPQVEQMSVFFSFRINWYPQVFPLFY